VLTDDLLELQHLDTTHDQLIHRRSNLPEREQAAAAEAELRRAEQRRVAATARDTELEAAISALEAGGQTITAQRSRLEAQLKTVVAPREAEALMHELDALARRRDELDDVELGHLDEQSTLAEELAALAERLPSLRDEAENAAAALVTAEGAIDRELAESDGARDVVAARVDSGLLARYQRLRERYRGVAVARLEGSRCGGCHLDLSTTELAEVRASGPGEFADCPQCGRLLVP
jgi:uncharacterized protein